LEKKNNTRGRRKGNKSALKRQRTGLCLKGTNSRDTVWVAGKVKRGVVLGKNYTEACGEQKTEKDHKLWLGLFSRKTGGTG